MRYTLSTGLQTMTQGCRTTLQPLAHWSINAGRRWDCQASPDLTKILHDQVEEHFHNYKNKFFDKNTIPLYPFFSGAGTGTSRNATELDKTIYKCFDGTYFEKNELLTSQVHILFVFHSSFESGTSFGQLKTIHGEP